MNRTERIINASEKALVELEKVIRQRIDLDDLDPEKAKVAAQAKWVAIEDSLKIIQKIEELNTNDKKDAVKFLGVEDRLK